MTPCISGNGLDVLHIGKGMVPVPPCFTYGESLVTGCTPCASHGSNRFDKWYFRGDLHGQYLVTGGVGEFLCDGCVIEVHLGVMNGDTVSAWEGVGNSDRLTQ
jgi:hypothetical protein